MKTIKLSDIEVPDRQRSEIKQVDLDKLKLSIVSKGLMHPVILTNSGRLIAGERRLRAIEQLHQEQLQFHHDAQPIEPDEIPYVNLGDLSPADLAEAELDENMMRVNLSWQEQVDARVLIHNLRLEQNPEQTIRDTAQEIASITGRKPEAERDRLADSLLLHRHKDHPKVKRAKTAAEAVKAIIDEGEAMFQARLAMVSSKTDPAHTIIHGDCREELPKLNPGQFAAIICDPPYGISMNKQGKESNHYYDDSPENALQICKFVIEEGFKLCKPRAILFMFCDIDHFLTLRDHCSRHAWSTWRVPLIWTKGPTGHAPWGRAGFTRSYETILFAVKGQQELRIPGGPDHFDFARVSRGNRTHGAEKPTELLSHLISLSCLPGDKILDPCAGSGAIITAARQHAVETTCVELDAESYNLCTLRATQADEIEYLSEEPEDESNESSE